MTDGDSEVEELINAVYAFVDFFKRCASFGISPEDITVIRSCCDVLEKLIHKRFCWEFILERFDLAFLFVELALECVEEAQRKFENGETKKDEDDEEEEDED